MSAELWVPLAAIAAIPAVVLVTLFLTRPKQQQTRTPGQQELARRLRRDVRVDRERRRS